MRERLGSCPKGRKRSSVDPRLPGKDRGDFVMERFGKIQDAGRSFDIEYWQRQGDAVI